MSESKPVELPVLQAIILAEHVYEDRGTGKKIIAGTFNRLWLREFPSEYSQPSYVFICLTNVRGKVPLTLRYVDLSNNEVLMELQYFPFQHDDPLETVELVIQVPSFPLPHEGVYTFDILSDEQILGCLRVYACLLQDEPE